MFQLPFPPSENAIKHYFIQCPRSWLVASGHEGINSSPSISLFETFNFIDLGYKKKVLQKHDI